MMVMHSIGLMNKMQILFVNLFVNRSLTRQRFQTYES
ncbi:hypothetical protein BRC2024_YMPIZCAT_CDS_0020 [Acinetobacter phage vB_AbaP_Margaret]